MLLDAPPPLFSVIIPLEYHRGQWERSWLGWTSQTLDKSAFEIILVVPPDFPHREELSALAGSAARIEFADRSHDIGLCAIGAAKAQGKYLFLTESHCWPEPDVLELCSQAVRDHPDWAGFSCKSLPICHNRPSEAEADMYQSDIEFGMLEHPWRKVLDQCFVTRRDVYEECGGLRAELGHFAEWVLAAAYHARGHKIGYLEQARFHHYYIGDVDELKVFTLDFVRGEIGYLSEGSSEPGHELLEAPPEWSCQDNFDREMARSIVGAIARGIVTDVRWRQSGQKMRAMWRWVWPAVFGDGLARVGSSIAAIHARLILRVTALAGPRESVARWMKIYIASLIHRQRLISIHAVRSRTPAAPKAVARLGAQVLAQTGFYPLERYQDRAFRWSETEAAMRIEAPAGRHVIRIECIRVREPLDQIDIRFYLDGRRVADNAIIYDAEGIELRLDLPASGIGRLAWICRRFPAAADPRRLGLPVAHLEVIPDGHRGENLGAPALSMAPAG